MAREAALRAAREHRRRTADEVERGSATLFADPGAMKAWMAAAAPGHALIYARGFTLWPHEHPAAVLARQWKEQGLAQLNGPNTDKWGKGKFVAIKRASASAAPPDPARAEPPRYPHDPQFSETDEGRVYRLIAQFAGSGWCCPTNQAIAELLGFESHEAARYRFNRLVRAGHLKLIEGNRFGARVVEVAATGLRTASPKETNL